jgi:hypothetical protein
MYTAQGDFVCKENKNTIEYFDDVKQPDGTYKNSCANCSFLNNNLSCNCSKNKNIFTTQLDLSNCNIKNPNIRNIDGKLTCNPPPALAAVRAAALADPARARTALDLAAARARAAALVNPTPEANPTPEINIIN